MAGCLATGKFGNRTLQTRLLFGGEIGTKLYMGMKDQSNALGFAKPGKEGVNPVLAKESEGINHGYIVPRKFPLSGVV